MTTQVAGIPEGFKLVRIGRLNKGDMYVHGDGKPVVWEIKESMPHSNYPIVTPDCVIPDGYEWVRYGLPLKGDTFIHPLYNTPLVVSSNFTHNHHIVKPITSKTKEVTLYEYICWDDVDDEHIIVWSSKVNSSEDSGEYNAWNHAHLTGNTRTITIPIN